MEHLSGQVPLRQYEFRRIVLAQRLLPHEALILPDANLGFDAVSQNTDYLARRAETSADASRHVVSARKRTITSMDTVR